MDNTILTIINAKRGDHAAHCGSVTILNMPTEIDLVRAMKAHGIDLKDFTHTETYGTNYPFMWVWVRNK